MFSTFSRTGNAMVPLRLVDHEYQPSFSVWLEGSKERLIQPRTTNLHLRSDVILCDSVPGDQERFVRATRSSLSEPWDEDGAQDAARTYRLRVTGTAELVASRVDWVEFSTKAGDGVSRVFPPEMFRDNFIASTFRYYRANKEDLENVFTPKGATNMCMFLAAVYGVCKNEPARQRFGYTPDALRSVNETVFTEAAKAAKELVRGEPRDRAIKSLFATYRRDAMVPTLAAAPAEAARPASASATVATSAPTKQSLPPPTKHPLPPPPTKQSLPAGAVAASAPTRQPLPARVGAQAPDQAKRTAPAQMGPPPKQPRQEQNPSQ
jgi:hypothetical protein